MKKKPVKNRKRERQSKRWLYISFLVSSCLLLGSVSYVFVHYFLPKTYISPLTVSEKSGTKIKEQPTKDVTVSKVQKSLSTASIAYTNVRLIDRMTCEITLSHNEIVILSPQKDISSQIASLQLITSRLTMEGKRFSRLDLRYDQPVLTQ